MSRHNKLSVPAFLSGGGEMGTIIASIDWSKHPLGSPDLWPDELKTSLGTCLRSALPMSVYWGQKKYVFYNDAWSPIFGLGHKKVIGKPASTAWGGHWKTVSEPSLVAYKKKRGDIKNNIYLPLLKNGFKNECYFDFSSTPIFSKDNKVAGSLNTCHETSPVVLYSRRSRILRSVYEKSFNAESPEAACIHISNVLSEAPRDLPFALFYLFNNDKSSLRLAASTSIDTDNPIAKPRIELTKTRQPLPFAKVAQNRRAELVSGLDKKYKLPGGAWDEDCRQAIVMHMSDARSGELYGLLVLGLSPRLEYDNFYKRFSQQIAEQTAFSVGAAFGLKRKLTLESRENEARNQLQAALSTNLVGVWTWDIHDNRVYADKNLAYQLGIDNPDPISGVPASAFLNSVHPDEKKRLRKLIESAVSKTKRFEAEYRLYNRNKELRWVISRGKVDSDSKGKPIRFSGVTVDITDHKNVEIELATTEHMYSALFRSSIIGVAVASMDGKLHEANDTFLRMFGYSKRDFKKGLTSKMITPPSARGITSLIYSGLRESGEVEPVEKDYRRKDGTIIPTLVGAVMIPDTDDRFIAFILDISEQKQLLELNRVKDEFISIASHQLRTPATGVKQYLGMLIEGYVGEIDPAQLKILKTAYQSNERQLTIANDLLKVAQADASGVKLNLKRTGLNGFIEELLAEQQHNFALRGQLLKFTPKKTEIYCKIDKVHLRMAVENILDNAGKYMKQGKSAEVKISSTSKKVLIKVKDEGVGIRKNDLPKLFKKFSRIDNELSMSAGGSGLGLYWADKIVQLHGGTLKVSSRHKKGSEFVIELPTGVT